jgi:hypothetical protein
MAPNDEGGTAGEGGTKKVVLAPGTVITPEAPVVVPETKAKISLVIVGSVLLVAFAVGIVLARTVGNETNEVSSPATTAVGATGATGATGQAGATGATEVTKKTTTKNWASDGLLTALLGTGAALIVLGLMFNRLTTIKFAGAEVTLKDEEKEKVKEKVNEKAGQEQMSSAQVSAATVVALDNAKEEKLKQGVSTLSDAHLADAATQAVEQVMQ